MTWGTTGRGHHKSRESSFFGGSGLNVYCFTCISWFLRRSDSESTSHGQLVCSQCVGVATSDSSTHGVTTVIISKGSASSPRGDQLLSADSLL